MKIGDSRSSSHYVTPAEELHGAVLEAFESSSLFTRLQLAEALEAGTEWQALTPQVRALFETVARKMDLG